MYRWQSTYLFRRSKGHHRFFQFKLAIEMCCWFRQKWKIGLARNSSMLMWSATISSLRDNLLCNPLLESIVEEWLIEVDDHPAWCQPSNDATGEAICRVAMERKLECQDEVDSLRLSKYSETTPWRRRKQSKNESSQWTIVALMSRLSLRCHDRIVEFFLGKKKHDDLQQKIEHRRKLIKELVSIRTIGDNHQAHVEDYVHVLFIWSEHDHRHCDSV